MKDKSQGFWLKLMGGPPRKRLENHEKPNLCLWRGKCVLGEKVRFLTKSDRGSPTKKLVLMKGNMCLWRGKVQVFLPKLIRGTLRKRLENHENATCVYEREYVHIKGNSKGSWLKRIGGPLRKRLENQEKKLLVFIKANMCFWGQDGGCHKVKAMSCKTGVR